MSRFWILAMALCLSFGVGCRCPWRDAAYQPARLTIYMEEYPPLNFVADGEPTGQATEIVRELIARTGTPAEIRVRPWDEAYATVLKTPDTAIFSAVMTAERAPRLQWVGPIASLDSNFYARAGARPGLRYLADAKQVAKIVVVKDYYTAQQLRTEGFTNLEIVADEQIAIRKLLRGEAQLFPSNNVAMPALLRQVGAAPDAVERALNLSTDLTYVAFSRQVSPALVARWQQALDEMKADGTFARIHAKWLPLDPPPGVVQMITEEYPPITFMKDGKVSGFVTDMVREIASRQGLSGPIRLTSWDQAYKVALHNPNVALFSTERTAQREKLFHWVGPVGKNRAILYARKGSGITLANLDEARRVPAIATTTNWFTEQDLQSRGFTNLVSSPLPTDCLRKLMDGEVQLSVFTDITIPEIVANAGYRMADLEPVLTVSETDFHIALSRGTPPATVHKWQATLDEMKADGSFARIYRAYLPHADLTGLLAR